MDSKFLVVYTYLELEADLWILNRDEPWPGIVQETVETKSKKTKMRIMNVKKRRKTLKCMC